MTGLLAEHFAALAHHLVALVHGALVYRRREPAKGG
jgi:hypothetical protein